MGGAHPRFAHAAHGESQYGVLLERVGTPTGSWTPVPLWTVLRMALTVGNLRNLAIRLSWKTRTLMIPKSTAFTQRSRPLRVKKYFAKFSYKTFIYWRVFSRCGLSCLYWMRNYLSTRCYRTAKSPGHLDKMCCEGLHSRRALCNQPWPGMFDESDAHATNGQ